MFCTVKQNTFQVLAGLPSTFTAVQTVTTIRVASAPNSVRAKESSQVSVIDELPRARGPRIRFPTLAKQHFRDILDPWPLMPSFGDAGSQMDSFLVPTSIACCCCFHVQKRLRIFGYPLGQPDRLRIPKVCML